MGFRRSRTGIEPFLAEKRESEVFEKSPHKNAQKC
jgi:hypothetical protein